MSDGAARVFAENYISGFLDMITTMVGQEAEHELGEVSGAAPDTLGDVASAYGAVLKAAVQDGGGIALLMPAEDVYQVLTSFLGAGPDPQDPVAESDAADLKEVYEPCLGAGVSVFKERYGEVITLENIAVAPGGAEAAADLTALLGPEIARANFRYNVPPDLSGDAVLLFSRSLEAVIPADQLPADEGASGQKQDAVDDILSDVGIPQSPAAPGPAGSMPRPAPPNLEMILDIRLIVKARLGRVEMPIAEILSLGPGSIIEVGHLVDEPIELLVNDKLIARGDVVVVDEKFGLRITEIVSTQERIESMR
jgi:flagellar motor switch protein FliN/FliY